MASRPVAQVGHPRTYAREGRESASRRFGRYFGFWLAIRQDNLPARLATRQARSRHQWAMGKGHTALVEKRPAFSRERRRVSRREADEASSYRLEDRASMTIADLRKSRPDRHPVFRHSFFPPHTSSISQRSKSDSMCVESPSAPGYWRTATVHPAEWSSRRSSQTRCEG